ncbi:MAG: histidinol dehydrogenase, partial [Oscillospiraceae bacterium]|nr:histidinol dehydrogenase [Oscillospiraceae bacterium]
MIELIRADGKAEREVIAAMRGRASQVHTEIDRTVAEIMNAVKENGFAAVREYSLRFDRAEPKELAPEELEAAYGRCDGKLISALEHAAANIRDYNEKLLTASAQWRSPDGGIVGRVV